MSETTLSDLVEKFKTNDNRFDHEIFINTFMAWLEAGIESDDIEIEFDGNGAYFGKQVTIKNSEHALYYDPHSLSFEIAYDINNIVIYTARHNGFWVNPYFSISSEKDTSRFYFVYYNLIGHIKKLFGLT